MTVKELRQLIAGYDANTVVRIGRVEHHEPDGVDETRHVAADFIGTCPAGDLFIGADFDHDTWLMTDDVKWEK